MGGVPAKYKDSIPLSVIERARRILSEELGVLTVENWLNPLEGFYSVNVRSTQVPMFSNGKGVTRELALASAYGEFMERLQNLMLYDTVRFGPDVLEHRGFFHSPDEKLMTIDAALGDPGIASLLPAEVGRTERERIFSALSIMTPQACTRDFIAVPFSNTQSGGVQYVPLPFLRTFYGSNGMCAGSTPAEALVQGLSEVMERYVNREIVKQRIVPPTIPDDYLSRYAEQYAMIKRIEQSGDCRIIIKDCSLGKGYPVVGLIYMDLAKHAYFVKFGAHPAFEIALERTLTELLQGREIEHMAGLTEFAYYRTHTDPSRNLMNIFIDGSGHYPIEFFGSDAGYAFTPFPDHPIRDNRSLLAYLFSIISGENRAILVRDVSFLGFPAFHIVVPGMSEILDFSPAEVERICELAMARNIVNGPMDHASPDELERVVSALKDNYFVNTDSIAQLVNPPVDESFPWKEVKTDLFCSMVHLRLGDPGKAYEHMKRFVADIEADPGVMGYYKCSRDYLGMISDGFTEAKAVGVLEGVYGPKLTREVMADLSDPGNSFKYLGRLKCWDCEDCSFINSCSYQELRRIHMAVKDRYFHSQVDQNDSVDLLHSAS